MRLGLVPWTVLLLLGLDFVKTQLGLPSPGNINQIAIQLVNATAPNEGRVLVRLSQDSPWTAVCHDRYLGDIVPFLMCRRLGYPFACGYDEAGTHRTDEMTLVGVASEHYFAVDCFVDGEETDGDGCSLGPSLEPPCTHNRDMWLTCGYAGMPDFELRLGEGALWHPRGLLQGRCGTGHEWGAICSNYFHPQRTGRVACRDLGFSDYAIWPSSVTSFDEVDAPHKPNYTLFAAVGCIGNETSLTECQHTLLQVCQGYPTLQCFTGTKKYNETAYLCGSKQLCGDQCQQIHPIPGSNDDEFHYCQCDELCGLFDDCCYDFSESCSLERTNVWRGGFATDQFGCVWVPGSQFTYTGYVAVNQCPISWTDEGTRDLCERPVNVTDVIGSLPVYDEQYVDFKNIYCAICNGRSLNGVKRWNVSGTDRTRNPSEKRLYPSLDEILPTNGWLITPPTGHAISRECPAHLVEACRDEYRGTQLEEACRAYYAPILLKDSDARYRNPHCAMCNGKDVPPDYSCMDEVCHMVCDSDPWGGCEGFCDPLNNLLTIEVLFDLQSSSSPITGATCSEGQIYDPFLERCRTITCAPGYQIRGDECVVASSVPPLGDDDDDTMAECLSEHLGQNVSGTEFSVDQLETETKSGATALSVFFLVNSAFEALEIEMAFDNAVASIQNTSLSTLVCNIFQFSILMPFPNLGSSACTNSTINGSEIFQGYAGSFLRVVEYHKFPDEEEFAKTMTSTLCLKINDLNCSSFLTLETTEYNHISNDSIEVVATGTNIYTAGYILFPDDTAVVCSFIQPVQEGLEPRLRRMISFVGSCLSLIALAATFLTYIVLSDLRNNAGKLVMNLVVALFTAILLFLLPGYLRENHAACVSWAVLAHFAWLVTFFSMTVLAVNAARILTSSVQRCGGGAEGFSRSFVASLCLAWGIPLVIVSVCLILQYCKCTSLPVIYAEGATCWITNSMAHLAVFVAPVALSLAINLCLYVFTLVSIRKRRHGTTFARNQGKMEGALEEITIYTKLSTLVGVTWVFGFLITATGILAFSYIYIILNYLQGIFIFVAFCLNKRVRGLWKERVCKRKERLLNAKPAPGQHAKDSATQPTDSTSGATNETTEDTKL